MKKGLKNRILAFLIIGAMILTQGNGVSADSLEKLSKSTDPTAESQVVIEPSAEALPAEDPAKEVKESSKDDPEATLPSSDEKNPTDPASSEDPADPAPIEEPTDQEPVEEPTDQEPVEEPTDQEPVEEPTDQEPVEEPTDQEPVEEPTDKEAPIEKEPFVPEQTVYTAELNEVIVRAEVTKGAFEEEVELFVRVLEKGTDGWKFANDSLQKNGYTFDGMLAYDIGFMSKASGTEIEPKGQVAVRLEVLQAGLAEINAKPIDYDSIVISHISGKEVDKVADTLSKAGGSVELDGEKLTATFLVDSFSTFTITWENAEQEEQSATIHWGTYEEEAFVEFDSITTIDISGTSVDLAVIVDDDYYYVGVDYKADENSEVEHVNASVLKKVDGVWKIGDITLVDGCHLYVNYAPKSDGQYTPPPKPTGDMLAPETDKTVTDNGDGTYTIRLDVVGHEDENITQVGANVIVIMDITQSMTNRMPNSTQTRMAAAKQALTTLVNVLDPDTNLINFTAVNFGVSQNGATLARDWTSLKSDMTAYVTGLPNSPSDYGTNWKAGLLGGRSRVENAAASPTLSKNETYVIFVTDGNPNCYTDNNGGWHGSSGPNFNQQAYNAAVATANWLGANSHFYGVFVGDADGYDHLEDLINGANGVDTINGSTTAAIEEAFANIASTIVENLGVGHTVVDDGIPALANISANVSGGEAGGFRYYITPKNGTEQEWEDHPGATYDQQNGVTWNLGEVGTLKDGWTYSLEFTVWPSQAAYDLIANLNNQTIKLTDTSLTDEVKAQLEITLGTSAPYKYDKVNRVWSNGGASLTDAQL